MKKYVTILLHRHISRLKYDFSKGLNLPIAVIGSVCYFFMHLLGFSLVISKFSFPGWSSDQLWIMFFTFETYTYLCFHFFGRGLLHTKQDISLGSFDHILIKPMPIQFLSLFREGSFNNLVSLLLGISLLTKTIINTHLSVSLFSVLIYIFFISVGLFQFHLISASIITLNFVFGHLHGSAGLALNFQEAWKYPAESFRSNFLSQLIVYPVALATTIPALFLLHKSFPIFALIVYITWTLFLVGIYKFAWVMGLRHYSSASS